MFLKESQSRKRQLSYVIVVKSYFCKFSQKHMSIARAVPGALEPGALEEA